jgi:hypothetical protein
LLACCAMKFCVRLMHVVFLCDACVCPVIYLKILQEFMNFMVSAMHLPTVMFQIFMEKQEGRLTLEFLNRHFVNVCGCEYFVLRMQSKVGNIFLVCSIITHQFVSESLLLIT